MLASVKLELGDVNDTVRLLCSDDRLVSPDESRSTVSAVCTPQLLNIVGQCLLYIYLAASSLTFSCPSACPIILDGHAAGPNGLRQLYDSISTLTAQLK